MQIPHEYTWQSVSVSPGHPYKSICARKNSLTLELRAITPTTIWFAAFMEDAVLGKCLYCSLRNRSSLGQVLRVPCGSREFDEPTENDSLVVAPSRVAVVGARPIGVCVKSIVDQVIAVYHTAAFEPVPLVPGYAQV